MANCTSCSKCKVNRANYCWHCGTRFGQSPSKTSFESELPVQIKSQSVIGQQVAEAILIFTFSYAGALWLKIPPGLSIAPPLLLLIGRPILETYWNAPKREPEPDKTLLKVEYKSENSRHWLLDTYPEQIGYRHLQHIAKICIMDKGTFSRRNICRTGLISQESYRILHAYWKKNNMLIVRKNKHNMLTERCWRLLKKTLPTPV